MSGIRAEIHIIKWQNVDNNRKTGAIRKMHVKTVIYPLIILCTIARMKNTYNIKVLARMWRN
jgi:hypothetical protein